MREPKNANEYQEMVDFISKHRVTDCRSCGVAMKGRKIGKPLTMCQACRKDTERQQSKTRVRKWRALRYQPNSG